MFGNGEKAGNGGKLYQAFRYRTVAGSAGRIACTSRGFAIFEEGLSVGSG